MLKNKSSRKPGKIRIIAGKWRGRKLSVIDFPGLRPTTDRIRETLFNWLTPAIINAHCLDCFAGTGVLGLEALSRYAARAIFIDNHQHVVQQIQTNLNLLKEENAQVIRANTLDWLNCPNYDLPFDIVFLDPPFHQALIQQCICMLEQHHWLADEALVYVETEMTDRQLITPSNWSLLHEKIAGQVSYRLYRRYAN